MNRSSVLNKTITALLVFVLPTWLVRPLLNAMGHCVLPGGRVGFSWLWCGFVGLDRGARIGHLNLIAVRRLMMREGAYFGRLNVAKGPVNVVLKSRAAVGNANRVLRGPAGVSSGPAQLWLGELTKITANHRVDCTQSVRIGAFTVIGGAASQLWTHGYVHEMDGAGRYRIDGRIEIENNVYIGSACLVSMGVRIAKGVIVGGGTSVSQTLTEPGLYVSAPVRALARPAAPQERPNMCRLTDPHLMEPVFLKRRP
jgi:acetyltransferase-like isoleucine patch superfamily enzyme